jgi:hypothetical protein
MSRVTEIIENNHNLDQLFSIVRHYGVNAEYISAALIQQFEQESENGEDGEENKKEKGYTQELVDDMKQFYARF